MYTNCFVIFMKLANSHLHSNWEGQSVALPQQSALVSGKLHKTNDKSPRLTDKEFTIISNVGIFTKGDSS